MSKNFRYLTNCVHSTADLIIAMTTLARQITYETLIQHVSVEELERVFSSYSYRGEHHNRFTGELTSPLHIKRDYAVSFWKSTYDGKPCYYVEHSRIEYIFVEEE